MFSGQSKEGNFLVALSCEDGHALWKNDLGENCYASPALSHGQIFLRGATNLYCIGRVEK